MTRYTDAYSKLLNICSKGNSAKGKMIGINITKTPITFNGEIFSIEKGVDSSDISYVIILTNCPIAKIVFKDGQLYFINSIGICCKVSYIVVDSISYSNEDLPLP